MPYMLIGLIKSAYINVVLSSILILTLIFSARGSIIYLNVIEVSRNPRTPLDFDVPLPVSEIDALDDSWDLTTRQVSVKIDVLFQ